MVLSIIDTYFPYRYTPHLVAAVLVVSIVRALAQGRKTNRERDLRGRTFIITGGFTPLGLTLLQSLSQRGAKILALSPHSIDSTRTTILINLLRATFNNEEIYAEQCNLQDHTSVREFCMRFLTDDAASSSSFSDKTSTSSHKPSSDNSGKKEGPLPPTTTRDKRIDGLIFLHEYAHIGFYFPRSHSQSRLNQDQEKRDTNSLSTFLLTTLLLPLLLTSPVERDIRIINVVNPFYAAASTETTFDPTFSITSSSSSSSSSTTTSSSPSSSFSKSKHNLNLKTNSSIFLKEAHRSLNTIILTRHFQRILDALPSSQPPLPKTSSNSLGGGGSGTSVPVVNPKLQKSNIVTVSVVPGISRVDTVKGILGWSVNDGDGDEEGEGKVGEREGGGRNWVAILLYLILLPLLHLTTKSPKSAIETVLHALFLPTPFKIISADVDGDADVDVVGSDSNSTAKVLRRKLTKREEVLKPGALYRECAVVNLDVKVPSYLEEADISSGNQTQNENDTEKKVGNGKGKGKGKGDGKRERESGIDMKEEIIEIKDDDEYGGELAGRLVWEAYEAGLKVWESKGSGSKGGSGGEKR